jgi:hypothetical protein
MNLEQSPVLITADPENDAVIVDIDHGETVFAVDVISALNLARTIVLAARHVQDVRAKRAAAVEPEAAPAPKPAPSPAAMKMN